MNHRTTVLLGFLVVSFIHTCIKRLTIGRLDLESQRPLHLSGIAQATLTMADVAVDVIPANDSARLLQMEESDIQVDPHQPAQGGKNAEKSSGKTENSKKAPAKVDEDDNIVVADNVHKTYLLGLEGVAALRLYPNLSSEKSCGAPGASDALERNVYIFHLWQFPSVVSIEQCQPKLQEMSMWRNLLITFVSSMRCVRQLVFLCCAVRPFDSLL